MSSLFRVRRNRNSESTGVCWVVRWQLNKMAQYIQMSIQVLNKFSLSAGDDSSLPFCIICAREYPVKSTNPSEQ